MTADDVATVQAERERAGSSPARRSPRLRRAATVALWALVFALWTATRHLPYLSGLLFVLLGASALLLTTVAGVGWSGAALRTTRFCEAAARSAWTTGAVGAVVFFESVLFGPSEGLAAGARNLALSFVPPIYGGVLATGLLAWTLRSLPRDTLAPFRERAAGSAWELWLGRTLFTVLVAWPLVQTRWSVSGSRLVDSVWMVHWPAVLVLVGTLAVIRLIGGAAMRKRAASVALAGAGTLTGLGGLLQALLGIADADIAAVSAGMSFLITACFTTLLSLALVTFPLDDRDGQREVASPTALAARVAWVVYPLVTVGLMAIAFMMILTPMTRKL